VQSLKNIHVGLGICCQLKNFPFSDSTVPQFDSSTARKAGHQQFNAIRRLAESTPQFDSSTARKAGHQQFNAIRRLAESTPQFDSSTTRKAGHQQFNVSVTIL
jgi:hypothetical protein